MVAELKGTGFPCGAPAGRSKQKPSYWGKQLRGRGAGKAPSRQGGPGIFSAWLLRSLSARIIDFPL